MKQIALDIGLTPGPSLANFLAGQNQLVLEHLSLWVSNQVRSPVPTYLWGEMGCGKSHLLQAVRAALGEQGGLGSVGWMDPELAEPGAFSEDWQVVLLDDVHLYNAVQQHAAFNWFVNATSATDGQQRWVLASGAMPPSDLPVREDLRTRLAWGHVFQLQLLSEIERRSVLRQHADARGLFLSDEVMDYLLHRFSRDLASLMHWLDQLDRFALQTKRAITVPLVREMMEQL